MTRREARRIESDARRAAARIEAEMRASGVYVQLDRLRAEITRALAAFRARLKRSREWEAVMALEGLSVEDLEQILDELLRSPQPTGKAIAPFDRAAGNDATSGHPVRKRRGMVTTPVTVGLPGKVDLRGTSGEAREGRGGSFVPRSPRGARGGKAGWQ